MNHILQVDALLLEEQAYVWIIFQNHWYGSENIQGFAKLFANLQKVALLGNYSSSDGSCQIMFALLFRKNEDLCEIRLEESFLILCLQFWR